MPDHAKAKAFIFVYMAGGPSHLETWDPKPLLNKLDGQKRPAEFGDVKYQNVNSAVAASSAASGRSRNTGKSGIEVSDLFPHQAEIVDDLCIIRSMHGDMVVHSAAQYQMMTGRVIPGFPAMGSWITYGLGLGSGVAACLRRDAGSAWRAGSGRADVQERLSAGGVSADDVAAGQQAGLESRSAEGRLAGPSAGRPST